MLKGLLGSGYISLSDGENFCTIHKDQIPSSLRKRIRKVGTTKFFNPMMDTFECDEEIDLAYFVESEPGHVVKMKETFHVTSIRCDRWPIFSSFEWMKKTDIWPFYDENKRSGTLEEESEYETEGMDRYPLFRCHRWLEE